MSFWNSVHKVNGVATSQCTRMYAKSLRICPGILQAFASSNANVYSSSEFTRPKATAASRKVCRN